MPDNAACRHLLSTCHQHVQVYVVNLINRYMLVLSTCHHATSTVLVVNLSSTGTDMCCQPVINRYNTSVVNLSSTGTDMCYQPVINRYIHVLSTCHQQVQTCVVNLSSCNRSTCHHTTGTDMCCRPVVNRYRHELSTCHHTTGLQT